MSPMLVCSITLGCSTGAAGVAAGADAAPGLAGAAGGLAERAKAARNARLCSMGSLLCRVGSAAPKVAQAREQSAARIAGGGRCGGLRALGLDDAERGVGVDELRDVRARGAR